jgi:hypothetical protein
MAWFQNLCPLTSSAECDGPVRPALELGISDLFIRVGEGHDNSGDQLPLLPSLQGYLVAKYGADGSVGIFVGMMAVFVSLLFVLLFLVTILVIPLVIALIVLAITVHPLAGI